MTRRRIVFTDPKTGTMWATPEFNGDRASFERMGSGMDSCDAYWDRVVKCFIGVNTLNNFRKASKKAQSYYHSFAGDETLPLKRFDGRILFDEIYEILDGVPYFVASGFVGKPGAPDMYTLESLKAFNPNHHDPERITTEVLVSVNEMKKLIEDRPITEMMENDLVVYTAKDGKKYDHAHIDGQNGDGTWHVCLRYSDTWISMKQYKIRTETGGGPWVDIPGNLPLRDIRPRKFYCTQLGTSLYFEANVCVCEYMENGADTNSI